MRLGDRIAHSLFSGRAVYTVPGTPNGFLPSSSRPIPSHRFVVRNSNLFGALGSLCEDQGADLLRADLTKRKSACVERGAGGAHVVDEKHASVTRELGLSRTECAVDVAGSCVPVEQGLLRCVALALERVRRQLRSDEARNRTRQKGCLVVAAVGKTTRVEWNGNDDVHLPHEASRRNMHRSTKAWGQVGSIFVFEARDRRSHGASVLECGDARRRARRFTVGAFDRRGARRTEEVSRGHPDVASRAARWTDELAEDVGRERTEGRKRVRSHALRLGRKAPPVAC